MNTTSCALALILAAMTSGALAQPAQPAPAEPPCAQASGTGMPRERCGGPMHHGPRARWGRADTPGWRMMSDDERQAHRDRMAGLRDYDECKAYAQQHMLEMRERAKQRGLTMPAQPRHDACAPLKPAPAKPKR
ncbi:MAG: hypothetical protein EPO01_00280 [Aquabacterium sp.]|nr:MAG: hypothetical protein EPO01_00280 [Aquabacterium sp.]